MLCARCHRRYPPGVTRCPSDGAELIEGAVDAIRVKPSKETGAIIGDRYAIKGLLGKGGMGRVYLAEDLQTHDAVAVKIMSGDRVRDTTACERFLRESRAAQKVEHPNIIKTLDLGQRADGTPYLVLEYLHGESLGELLRRDELAPVKFILPLIRQAAAGLGAAHKAGIVHRDIKPDNLFLVGERGNPYTIKVVDFGLAKLNEGALTATGIAVGTLEYMAPEQILTDPVDARADVYSFGVLMYRALTGRLPFDAEDDTRLLAQQLIVAPKPVREHRSEVDPRIEQVVMTALRKHPGNRYPSMWALNHDLEEILIDNPISPRALAFDPDKFEPRGPRGKNALPFFYRAIGIMPPDRR